MEHGNRSHPGCPEHIRAGRGPRSSAASMPRWVHSARVPKAGLSGWSSQSPDRTPWFAADCDPELRCRYTNHPATKLPFQLRPRRQNCAPAAPTRLVAEGHGIHEPNRVRKQTSRAAPSAPSGIGTYAHPICWVGAHWRKSEPKRNVVTAMHQRATAELPRLPIRR